MYDPLCYLCLPKVIYFTIMPYFIIYFIVLFKLKYTCQYMDKFVCMFVAPCSEERDLGFPGISKRSMLIKINNNFVTPNYIWGLLTKEKRVWKRHREA